MLLPDHNAICHDCNQSIIGATVQDHHFSCTKCEKVVKLCHEHSVTRRCRLCGKGQLENERERLKSVYGVINGMF